MGGLGTSRALVVASAMMVSACSSPTSLHGDGVTGLDERRADPLGGSSGSGGGRAPGTSRDSSPGEHGPARPRMVYATLPAQVHVFWRTVEKGIQSAAEDHGYQALIRSAHDDMQFAEDGNVESKLTRFLVENGARTIILAPSSALDPSIEPVDAAVIFAGRGPDRFTLPYGEGTLVAIDSFEAGRKAAQALEGVLPAGARVGAFEINNRIETIHERVAGFASEAESMGFEVVFDDIPLGLEVRGAQTNARRVLEDHPELQAVFTPNELTTFGTARAIASLPADERPLHVGLDFREEFADLIRNGGLLAVVVQDPFLIGYESAETAIRLENGLPVPETIEVDTFVVNRENIRSSAIQDRLRHYAD